MTNENILHFNTDFKTINLIQHKKAIVCTEKHPIHQNCYTTFTLLFIFELIFKYI
ncbi:hypothetical protein T190130A13A_60144 [Tenacibaculum sp. 190130A14a]|uniref:Uncharacterized protein n=1 Tax=Tenacibaculum polynesiense TaxID=3137857 RepID=A0ABP1F756_9FLAO